MRSNRSMYDTEDDPSEETAHHPSGCNWTCWLVVLSLIMFAGFAATLLVAILTGDSGPIYTNMIIGFIVLAIVFAVVLLFVYVRNHRAKSRKSLRGKQFGHIQETFSPSDEEVFDHDVGDIEDPRDYEHEDDYDIMNYKPKPPIDAIMRDAHAPSVVGEMSVLSPHSFEMGGYNARIRPEELEEGNTPGSAARFGEHTPSKNPYGARGKSRLPFDFPSATSASTKLRERQDPPEHADTIIFDSSPSRNGRRSQDPSAPKISTDGFLIGANDGPAPTPKVTSSGRRWSLSSYAAKKKKNMEPPTPLYAKKEDAVPYNIDLKDEQLSPTSTVASVATGVSKAKSTVSAVSKAKSAVSATPRVKPTASSKSKSTATPKASAKSPKKTAAKPAEEASAAESQSEVMFSLDGIPKPPAPASEVGSTVSSMFLKPFNAMFGSSSSKKKTPTKEPRTPKAGYEAGSAAPTPRSNAPTPRSVASPKSVASQKSKATDVIADNRSDVDTVEKKPRKSEEPRASTPSRNLKPPKPLVRSSSSGSRKQLTPQRDEQPLQTISGGVQMSRTPKLRPPVPPSRGPPSAAGSEYAASEYKSTAGSSVFSGAASSTYDPQAHDRALRRQQRQDGLALGAEPVAGEYYDDDEDDDDQSADVHRTGAYDVIAPPGPIGIIVDTSDDGPVVHSLKKSSPMLGLINTGDIILALDGEDVRKMNAATLTKLMAKKSRQPERKITLMALDDY